MTKDEMQKVSEKMFLTPKKYEKKKLSDDEIVRIIERCVKDGSLERYEARCTHDLNSSIRWRLEFRSMPPKEILTLQENLIVTFMPTESIEFSEELMEILTPVIEEYQRQKSLTLPEAVVNKINEDQTRMRVNEC